MAQEPGTNAPVFCSLLTTLPAIQEVPRAVELHNFYVRVDEKPHQLAKRLFLTNVRFSERISRSLQTINAATYAYLLAGTEIKKRQ